MTAKQIFEELLQDPLLETKYQLSKEKIAQMSLHQDSSTEIVEVLKLVVNGVENDIPKLSVNSQIKTRFKI
jgi:hypothetical protein